MRHPIVSTMLWLLALPCCLAQQTRDLVMVEAGDVPENPVARFRVQVTVDRADRRYSSGDTLVLSITSSRDCYVTIFDVGTSGRVTVLLPNRFANGQDNFVQAGTTRSFPDRTRDGFEYTISPPPGLERIAVVATT